MKIEKQIGLTIGNLRRAKGISQEEFARRAGIDRAYMSNIENGRRQISIGIIERIAKALEMPMSELLKRVEEEWNRSLDA